nr:neurofilament medium polypeptide-like protein [Ipomoea batatas]
MSKPTRYRLRDLPTYKGWMSLEEAALFQVVKCKISCSSSEKVFYTMMNIVASSRNLRPNGLKTGRVPQFLVGLVVCIWLVYQITQPQHGSVRTKISVDEGVHSLGRKQTAGQLNVGGENLDMSNGEGESSSSTEGEGENIQVDLQGGGKRGEIAYSDETNKNNQGSSSNKGNLQSAKRGEIAYSDETNKNDQGSSSNQQGDLQDGKRVEIAYSDETNKNDQGSSTSKVSENLLETVTSYRGSDGKDVSQDKDEPAIDQEGEENSAATQNITIRSQTDVFSDENGIPKEMRDGSSLNDQSESS